MIGKVREAVCHVLAYELDCEFDEIKKLIRDFTAKDKWNFCIPVHKFKKPPEELKKVIDDCLVIGLLPVEVSGKFLNFYYDDVYYHRILLEVNFG